jgi:hypothetical protein
MKSVLGGALMAAGVAGVVLSRLVCQGDILRKAAGCSAMAAVIAGLVSVLNEFFDNRIAQRARSASMKHQPEAGKPEEAGALQSAPDH